MKKNNIVLQLSSFYSLLLIYFLLFSFKNYTQELHILPYYSFGFGESQFDNNVVSNSMGKITSSISNELENNQINFCNPAANKYALYTTFNLSGSIDLYHFNNKNKIFKNNNSTFSNVSISFPISQRFFFGIGCQPYTQFPYRTLYNEMKYYNKKSLFLHYGNSGINSFHTFISYYINSKLNIGLRINYLFGNFEKIIDFLSAKKNNIIIRDIKGYIFSGFQLTPGLFYSIPWNNKTYKLNIGLICSSIAHLSTDINFLRSKNIYTTDIYRIKKKSNDFFLLKYVHTNLKTYLPFDYSLGLSIQKNKRWLLGIEFLNKQLSKFVLSQEFISYKNQFRLSLGGCIIPNIKNYTHYLARVVYRFGIYYDNIGLYLFNHSIHQFGISCGLGLPIGEDKANPSKLNIGFELGKIGKLNFPIHEEIFFKIKVGLNLSEIWSNNVDDNN